MRYVVENFRNYPGSLEHLKGGSIFLFRITCISWFCALALVFPAGAQDTIVLNTEEYYPYNFSEKGVIKGTSTEVVEHVFKKAKIPYRLAIGPWVQSYGNALSQDNNCAYSTIRSEERSPLFKWVMSIESLNMVIYKLKDSPITATTLDDLKNLTIGGYAGDASAVYLKLRGFHVDEASTDSINPFRLKVGRVDVWVTSDFLGPRFSQEAGIEVEPVITLYEKKMGIACNKNIDDALIAKLQESLDAFNASGKADAIREQKKIMR